MITIVNYGMGNLNSVLKAFKRLNIDAKVSESPTDIAEAEKLILPGVGHFKNGMTELENRGLKEALHQAVIERGTPILGICLGAQLLTHHSEEGDMPGLGWIDAQTKRFDRGLTGGLKVPHMGWNTFEACGESPLLNELSKDMSFYFVHSYYMQCDDRAHALAQTTYGSPYDSIVGRDHIVGVQFHPEKSHERGLSLLQNFATHY